MMLPNFWKTMICAGLLIINTIGNFTGALNGFVPGPEAHASVQQPQLPTTSLSYQCISCHDGSRGQAIILKSADAPLQFTGHVSTNHPVGMRYSEYTRREPRSYVKPERLDKRILLENGDVTCVSCHQTNVGKVTADSGKMPADLDCLATGALTVTNRRTGLCMSCHIL